MGYILSGGDSYALSYIYLRAANSPNCVCKQQPILALFFYIINIVDKYTTITNL